MNNQESDYQMPEEELSSYELPNWAKTLVSLILLVPIIVSIILFSQHIEAPKLAASPKDLGLTPLIIFAMSGLVILWTPWKKLGIRVTKIGGLEFEKIVQEQANEHVEEQNDLNKRIEFLENHIQNQDATLVFTDRAREPELREMLKNFLTEYSTWAFSPARIKAWGAMQKGYENLTQFESPLIRNTLQKMVSDGELVTRVSKKGNTLYRIPKF